MNWILWVLASIAVVAFWGLLVTWAFLAHSWLRVLDPARPAEPDDE